MSSNAIYERARKARDPRFDGLFFIGVKTTGIYCRPICPANSPKSANVQYFASAAAAGEAGFRPCLRCRPECAPGTPAWNGTSTTVRRGLRLIAGGALNDGSVDDLALRLGVTARHLRRLFLRHIGASPLAVANTERLHFAKRLIDDTSLPMQDISVAAGFGSVRRFNDTFRRSYGRTPRELRQRRSPTAGAGGALLVSLPYRQPFDWPTFCEFLQHRATPGVETVKDGRYYRTIQVADERGVVELGLDTGRLNLSLHGVGASELLAIVQRVRDVLDLDAPVIEIEALLGRDPSLGKLLKAHHGIRVPGAWDGFEIAVRAILGQQVSVKAATTLAGRIANRYGEAIAVSIAAADRAPALNRLFPTAERLARARFNNIGLTGKRADTLRIVARAVVEGGLSFDSSQDPTEFCQRFTELPGIGDWTAQYVAMRALKYPDAFVASDLGILRALAECDGCQLRPAEVKQRAEQWRPWRAYAAMLLWRSIANSGG